MCGIFGIWNLDHAPVDPGVIRRATNTLRHRGPDDEGYLIVDTTSGSWEERRGQDTVGALRMPDLVETTGHTGDLVFGFRRLAILDLSPAGHQPMSDADGSLWIVYNGEIYNYIELRQELTAKGHRFHSGSDTEVILAAYAEWGEACSTRFNGMWAFALWDARRRQLFCSRDRFGIKPFYYLWDGERFAFGSEIKSLFHLPGMVRRANDPIVYDYLSAGMLDHTDETFFVGIRQLAPAHTLIVRDGEIHLRRYWDLPSSPNPSLSSIDYTKEFYDLFEDSIRLHLRSDVPIGTCLSGGLDSSSILCVANRLLFDGSGTKPEIVGVRQKTFSSCFEDARYDERQYIEQVLAATGAEQNYTFPDPQHLIEELPLLIWHQDEPFGSTSIYAQWCVMRLAAARGIKVLLDGQGGDELLAGYHGYFDYFWASLMRQGRLGVLWHELGAYHGLFGRPPFWSLVRAMRPFAPMPLIKLARRLRNGGSLGLNVDFARTFGHRTWDYVNRGGDAFYGYLRAALTQSSLPALLHYEDRNAMAHSIEARVPFLDHRLVEYVFSLPAEQKIQDGYTKTVMRHAMQGVLPDAIRLRTDKMGFVTPERVWLSGALREWARSILGSGSFKARDYFDAQSIAMALDDHASGKRDLTFLAWRWINLELWLRNVVEV